MALFTVGHSTLSQADFLAMLGGRKLTIIDARSHPTSKWPQFWKENLQQWLPEAGVGYEWWPELGGWDKRHLPFSEAMKTHGVDVPVYAKGKFPKQRIGVDKIQDDARQEFLPFIKPSWTNQGLYDYQWFMTLEEFLEGCDRLIERSQTEHLAYMCCECLYYKCHRSMIADYLSFRSMESHHIQPVMRQKNKVKFVAGYKLLPHSKVLGNRLDRYEPEVRRIWDGWKARQTPGISALLTHSSA